MKFSRIFVVLLVLLGFTTVTALAQDEDVCTELVERAMNAVEDDCSPTGRNQACYAYVSLEATPREGVTDFTFEAQGDLANVADLQTLRLSALDPVEDTWGIALMKLQANLPDTLPGQNVTFLLFGDVEIENAVDSSASLATTEITSSGNINVRSGPSTNFQVVGSLTSGETTVANGRSADSTWLRIQLPDSDAMGWVSASLVSAASDVSALSVVEAGDAEVPFTPMQAFYFRTGITETNCEDAPRDGILIQTPEGVGEIMLRANDVDIQLGSTAYLQAQPSEVMTVSVVEGQGTVTADGEMVVVPAGTQVEIPVDENLQASGAPSEPEPYDAEVLQTLPIEGLPEPIEIAAPAEDTGEDFAGGAFPAMPGMDFSGFEGMDMALFCQMMTQAFADAGMTTQDYIDMIDQYRAMFPPESLADLDEFIALMQSCQ